MQHEMAVYLQVEIKATRSISNYSTSQEFMSTEQIDAILHFASFSPWHLQHHLH